MIRGVTSVLSVMRVTTVSVNVLLVIVSVTRPGPVGAGGSSIGVSGFLIVTVTLCVCSDVGGVGVRLAAPSEAGLRKWAGIMAWNSSLVMGFGST